jgi:hypothetical protein
VFGCYFLEGHQGTMLPAVIDNDEGIVGQVLSLCDSIVSQLLGAPRRFKRGKLLPLSVVLERVTPFHVLAF